MSTLLWVVVGLLAVSGLLFVAWALCRVAADRLTIDQGESFGGDDDVIGR